MNTDTEAAAAALMAKSYEDLLRDCYERRYTRSMAQAKLEELHQTWKGQCVAARASAGDRLNEWFPV